MSKHIKKSLSVFLSAIILIGIFVVMPISASAITQSEFDNNLNSLRSQYPNYSTWYGSFDGGSQCYGFARLVGYNVFGSYPSSWSRVYSISNVKKGDILQYGNTSGNGHTVFVTNVSGDTITFVDCNGNGNYSGSSYVRSCGIKWDNTINKYSNMFGKYGFSYLLSSPDITNPVDKPTDNYVDIGTDFYAYITNTAYWLYLSNDYDNVSAKSPTFLSEQIWKFEKLNDNSYIIQSSSNDTVLEVNGTNVQTNYYNGGDNQKWYILKYGDNKYTIKSKSRNYVLDLEGNANISGTNIQIYEPNGTDAQYFSIHKYDAPSVTNINLEVNGSTVRVNWDNITGSTRYDVYLIQSPWGWDSVKYSKKCTFNSNYCEFKNISPGEYAAFVVTKPNENSKQSSWKYFTICYNDYMPDNQIIFNNHIYSLYNDTLTWEEAKVHCEEIGGHLVTITNKEEQNVITDLLKNQYCRWYFLGASSTNNNGNYKWVTNEDFVYTNWNNNIPNSKDNYLMATTRLNGNWEVTNNNGYDCAIGYICEIESASIHPSNTQYYKSNKYELYDKTLTWEDANQLAKIKGGHLVTITSQEEEDFIEKLINNGNEYYYWLGGKKNSSNNFEWTNSENFNYSNWATNEPNNTNNVENYIFKYKSSGKWNDNINFINNIGFIIEYDNYIKLGDINSDGKISVNDVTELQMYISQSKDFSDEQKMLADYNQDGIIDVLDVTDIQQLIANS